MSLNWVIYPFLQKTNYKLSCFEAPLGKYY
jgi:hypothetical protein